MVSKLNDATGADGDEGVSLPTFSIVIPAYNAAPFVETAAKSALGQRVGDDPHPGVEVLVVDDGSTDCTAKVVNRLARADPRLRLIHQDNQGVCRARNIGLAQARGDYVLFLDADDVLLPLALHDLSAAMSACPGAVMAFGAAVRIDENDIVFRRPVIRWVHDDSFARWIAGNQVGTGSGALVRTSIARSVGGYDETMRAAEGEAFADWLFYLDLRRQGPTICVPAPTVAYRDVTDSMSADAAHMFQAHRCFYQRVSRRSTELASLVEQLERGALVDQGAFQVSTQLLEGRWRSAIETLRAMGNRFGWQTVAALPVSQQSMLYWRRAGHKGRRLLQRAAGAEIDGYPVPLQDFVDRCGRSRSDSPLTSSPSQNAPVDRPRPADVVDPARRIVRYSVCIPSYDRADKLETLLGSLAADPALVADSVEVIVALDGSTDRSAEMLSELEARYPVPLRWVWHENRGRSGARNTLIDEASGEILWFLDDDMVIDSGTFTRHATWDRSRSEVMFGPSYVVGNNEGLALFYEYRWRELAGRPAIDQADVVSFANTTIPAAVLQRHRFDESFVGYGFEDYELALRMLDAGVTVGFDIEAPVRHHNDKSGIEMLANIRDEGLNRVHLARLHPSRGSFALDLRPGRLSRMLRPIAERGWSRPMWCLAHVVRTLAMPLRGERSFRVIKIADDLALYSGLAQAWKTPSP